MYLYSGIRLFFLGLLISVSGISGISGTTQQQQGFQAYSRCHKIGLSGIFKEDLCHLCQICAICAKFCKPVLVRVSKGLCQLCHLGQQYFRKVFHKSLASLFGTTLFYLRTAYKSFLRFQRSLQCQRLHL